MWPHCVTALLNSARITFASEASGSQRLKTCKEAFLDMGPGILCLIVIENQNCSVNLLL